MKQLAALGLIVLLTAAPGVAQPAHAGLRFCNQANFKFNVAVGYVDREKGWVGKGWSVVEGGQCKDAITTPLDNRYYYFFATGRGQDRQPVKYVGETSFCIEMKRFVLYQAQYGKNSQEECARAGLQSEMFRKIDTQNKPDFTINLRGSDALQGPGAGSGPFPPGQGAGPPPMQQGPGGAPPRMPQSAGPPPRPTPPPVQQPPANQPPAPPSAAPGAGGNVSPACQRYPNLC